MRVLLDTDVLLDVALSRSPHVMASEAVVEWCEAQPGRALIAWHTLSNLYYILRPKHGEALAREFVHDLLEYASVVQTGTAAAKHALALPMKDFEDAMQVAAAVLGGADYILTRNVTDFVASPVPAKAPADFLAVPP